MSEFTPIHPSGGGSSPQGGKKKLNKKTIALYGGLAIGAFLLISNLFKGSSGGTSQEAGGTADYPNPMNSADVQSQLQNFSSIMNDQLETGLSQIGTDVYNDQQSYKNSIDQLLAAQKTDYEAQLKKQNDNFNAYKGADEKHDASVAQQLKDLLAKNAAQDKEITGLKAKPASKPATKPASKPASKPTSSKPMSAAEKLIKGIGSAYKGASIVDYLKSAGKGSSMTDRKKIAATLGIKNYTGTAAQNTLMLKKLRSDGK